MSIVTTRRHAEISDLSPKKVSPDPPQNIRHAATALTGMGCSVAATIVAFFVSATPTKSATSIEPCLVIRNTGNNIPYSFLDFVGALLRNYVATECWKIYFTKCRNYSQGFFLISIHDVLNLIKRLVTHGFQ